MIINSLIKSLMEEIKTYTFVNGDGQIIEVVSKQQALKVIAKVEKETTDRVVVELLENGVKDSFRPSTFNKSEELYNEGFENGFNQANKEWREIISNLKI